MWAFEWHDTTKPIKVSRGDPLFYATFETLPQDRSVVMSEAEVTPELTDYMELISGAVMKSPPLPDAEALPPTGCLDV